MLVEMDGFETNLGVIVVAATNRPDILDAALLRPGRFDRQVYVTLPDIRGREQILNVHMRKIPIGQDVNAGIIARGTPGMSGADLANLCNEAALMAARRSARVVEMQDFEKAKDKIIMGPERKSMVMPEEERRNTAYHESGHAIIGKLLPKCDPVHKVTIIPRGRALGVTMSLPEKDRYSYDREYMLNQISMLFGGRIAEEVFMNQMTTGASNDFERATHLARDMVMRYGMTDALGPMVYAENEGEVFLGRSVTKTTNISEQTMQKVDLEVRRIIDEQYALARKLIEDNSDKMHRWRRRCSNGKPSTPSRSTTSWPARSRVRPRTSRRAPPTRVARVARRWVRTRRRTRRKTPAAIATKGPWGPRFPCRRCRHNPPMHMQWQTSRFRSTSTAAVMGIVNVTPDSFSDGGRFVSTRTALRTLRATC
jgi:ATP-dependent metalloprotease FtsH